MDNTKYLSRWKRNRAIVSCEVDDHDRVVNASTNILIPFSPRMPQEHYDFYRMEAEFPGLVSQYANILVAGLLRKPPECNMEVDVGLLAEAVLEELTTGRGFLWVDLDAIRVLRAEELKVWAADGSRVTISLVVEEWVNEEPTHVQYEYQYKLVDGVVKLKKIRDSVPVFDDVLQCQGRTLDAIPVYPLNGSLAVQPTVLQPLLDREVGLYNKLSRRNHLLYGAASYTPVISSDMSDQQFDQIVERGIGSWIRLEKEGKANILAAPTEALDRMEKAIEATISDMARMGIRILAPEGSSGDSGVALEIRNSAQTAQLGLLNTKMSEAFQRALQLHNEWRTENPSTEVVEFKMSADFNPVPLGADWMRVVTDWYTGGLIPRDLWLSIGRANDVIPADYDDAVGSAKITSDPLVPGRSKVTIDA